MATELEITDIEIKGLKSKDKVYTKHFGGGFYVYVLPTGRKVCRYCYQADGKIRRYELGDYVAGKGKLKELVAEYNRVHSNRIHNKIDPVAENDNKKAQVEAEKAKLEAERRQKEAEALKESGRITFDDVAEAFLKKDKKGKYKYQGLKGGKVPSPRTMQGYKFNLDRLTSEFGQYPMDDLPEEKIMDFLDGIATDKPVMANRLFSTLSVVCTWSVKQKRYNIRKNPFIGMDRPGGKEESKNRVLDFRPDHKKFKDKGEIKQFWQWLDTINPQFAIAFKLILMTGLRPGEVLGLEWQDIDDEDITLPAEKTKNKKDIHTTPLTPKLKELIDDLKAIAGDSGYLFKAKKFVSGERVDVSVKSSTLSRLLWKAMADCRVNSRGKEMPAGALHGIERFSPHDLRRTCGTHIGDLGFSMFDVAVLLNHSQGGVTAIYNKSDGTAKKVAMLESWHRRLDQLIEGKEVSNVVDLRA
ncbi:tyrosine-type recombinase/integrase [Gammaproteobacteria bacterium]|nr:tyrosine-type recombinase/integrase [Gammaproteobacteria bacterium]